MGGLCSRSANVDNAPGESFPSVNGHFNHGSALVYQSRELKVNSNSTPSPVGESVDDKQLREPFSFAGSSAVQYGAYPDDINDGIPRLPRALSHKSTRSKQVAAAKVCPSFILVIDGMTRLLDVCCCWLCLKLHNVTELSSY